MAGMMGGGGADMQKFASMMGKGGDMEKLAAMMGGAGGGGGGDMRQLEQMMSSLMGGLGGMGGASGAGGGAPRPAKSAAAPQRLAAGGQSAQRMGGAPSAAAAAAQAAQLRAGLTARKPAPSPARISQQQGLDELRAMEQELGSGKPETLAKLKSKSQDALSSLRSQLGGQSDPLAALAANAARGTDPGSLLGKPDVVVRTPEEAIAEVRAAQQKQQAAEDALGTLSRG